jgi:hypothetical protein
MGSGVPTLRSSNSSVVALSPSYFQFQAPDQSIKDDLDRFFLSPPSESERRRQSAPSAPVANLISPPVQRLKRPKTVAAAANHITSFPPLMKRHCTNDWVIPPANLDEDKPSSLYNEGVDAHPCSYPLNHELNLDKDPRCTRIYSTAPRSISASKPRSPPSRDASTVGSKLGVSSGRRFSNHAHQINLSRESSVIDKLRQSSIQLGQAIAAAINVGDSEKRKSSVAQMKAILDKYPPSQQPVEEVISETSSASESTRSVCRSHDVTQSTAATGESFHDERTGGVVWRRDIPRKIGCCSEDSQPHLCLVAGDGASSDPRESLVTV